MRKAGKPRWILFTSTYPPRECGIATFTQDLTNAVAAGFSPNAKPKIAALNDDTTNIYNYPDNVLYQINETDIQDYIDVAKEVNSEDRIKAVNVQHEFGIYGGECGSYLLPFLETLNKPVVTTFHTVLPGPDEKLKKAVNEIAAGSAALVVMNKTAVNILRNDYGLKGSRIHVIPHGIPPVKFTDSSMEKARLGYKGNIILSSFGMMNSGKGYEYVINALPEVLEKFPNVVYIIVGETHPVVRRREGEGYRNSLEDLVEELGLEDNVKFYNKYVKVGEIIKYLQASDIYVCSNKNPNQIVSGTLSYALGCGRAVVSTPFLHAREAVTPERGLLAEFGNPKSFSEAIIRILSDQKLKERMEYNAYAYTRHMTWPNVAISYMDVFREYIGGGVSGERLPKPKLEHLMTLTDDHGIIQFAKHAKPDKDSGYTLDDNARALTASARYYSKFGRAYALELVETYVDFIERVQDDSGRMYNLVDRNGRVMKEFSEDAHGRGMWALGGLAAEGKIPERLRLRAQKLFRRGIAPAMRMTSPRTEAFTIIGLYYYNKVRYSDGNVKRITELADRLVSRYNDNSSDQWKWFEPYVTYANSRLCEALLYAHLATRRKKYLNVALSTLDFLASITFKGGMFTPIGHDGWYLLGGRRAHFDQQPIEASSMVQALMLAYKVTRRRGYRNKALKAFNWFLGRNHLNQVIYDEKTGGCHDGLGHEAINLNQGAESTVVYLLARLSIK